MQVQFVAILELTWICQWKFSPERGNCCFFISHNTKDEILTSCHKNSLFWIIDQLTKSVDDILCKYLNLPAIPDLRNNSVSLQVSVDSNWMLQLLGFILSWSLLMLLTASDLNTLSWWWWCCIGYPMWSCHSVTVSLSHVMGGSRSSGLSPWELYH